jgi:hypothetical protein
MAVTEMQGQSCRQCSSADVILFEPGCRLQRIGRETFFSCSALKFVCIPPSVETIPEGCFCNCLSLLMVTFESSSNLGCILFVLAIHHCSRISSHSGTGLFRILPKTFGSELRQLLHTSLNRGRRLLMVCIPQLLFHSGLCGIHRQFRFLKQKCHSD